MKINIILNKKPVEAIVSDDMILLDFLREQECYSVKRGCETSNCGLCTVLVDETPILSCAYPLGRANGKSITTLEGLQTEAKEFGAFMADEGSEQCGFCSPGFIMNVLAMSHEFKNPSDTEILNFLSGNMCRCTGYEGQLRAIKKYLSFKEAQV
ncbi:MAG: (2Fe-2S)-binding protein [Anaerotignum sp.]